MWQQTYIPLSESGGEAMNMISVLSRSLVQHPTAAAKGPVRQLCDAESAGLC